MNKARSRRNIVLSKMHERGEVTDDEYRAALSEPIGGDIDKGE